MNNAVIIFTRVPEPGKTKTRLMPFLSGEECSSVHKAFLKDLLRNKKRIEADWFVSFTPAEKEEEIKKYIPNATGYFPQIGENFGIKMENAFRNVFEKGYKKVILTGTDIPQINETDYEKAFLQLDQADIVMNPTADGGYYLIGMKKIEDVFAIPYYGTNTVWENTIENIKEKGLVLDCGRKLRDIDTKEDLEYLQILLKRKEAEAPATEEWLNERMYPL